MSKLVIKIWIQIASLEKFYKKKKKFNTEINTIKMIFKNIKMLIKYLLWGHSLFPSNFRYKKNIKVALKDSWYIIFVFGAIASETSKQSCNLI